MTVDVSDLPLSLLVANGRNVLAVRIENDERIRWANDAFWKLFDGPLVGASLADLFLAPSCEAIRAAVRDATGSSVRAQLARDVRVTVRLFVSRTATGFAMVGEPELETYAELEQRLMALNAELAALARERGRQARTASRLYDELRDAHWHIRKTSAVLPMCVTCRAVQTDADGWQDAGTFMARNADFLSHGYCASCADALLAQLESDDALR